ncbi:MAG: HD domain-containing protein [Clostridia bacterium]|nr:HD domain-containing protein [Clostridia bacterium]
MLERAFPLIRQLNRSGFEAYAVGGCVRDRLLGHTADDVDITTNALPSDVQAVFHDFTVIPTGVQHGTVTVLYDGIPYEITTYRTDGTYSDGRHPDDVRFTSSLEDDLARRDFTVNAMAYHPEKGLIDPFGGMDDLKAKRLRCVGHPERRFSEDALRIARLIRFMSSLDFDADERTAAAAHALAARLDLVANERKQVELRKMVCGCRFTKVALQFSDILCRIVPPLEACVGFEQHNPHHDFDVYTHTVRAVGAAPQNETIRLALLFHDIGKPHCFSRDENGIGHFYDHPAISAEIAEATLRDLRFDNQTIRDVTMLVRHHDIPLPNDRKTLKRRLARFGEQGVRQLFLLRAADAAACRDSGVLPDFSESHRLLEAILQEEACPSLSSLALDGHDLLTVGYPHGPQIGAILHALLEAVIDEHVDNHRDSLLAYVKEHWPL